MRALYLLVAGSFVNSLGAGMTAFALGVHVHSATGSATAVCLVQLCALAPLVVLAPAAGVLADRHDRRLVMVVGDGGSIGGLLIVLVGLGGSGGLGVICVGALVSSCLSALTEPALRATVTELVPRSGYLRASGMLQMASAAKFLVAPIAAGALYGLVGAWGIVVVDAATCLVTVGCSLAVRRAVGAVAPREAEAGLRARLSEGWREVVGREAVRTLVLLMAVVTFAMGAVQSLVKPILLPVGSAGAVGLAETVAAVGLLAGSALVAARPSADPVRLLVAGLVGAGAAMTAVCLRPGLLWFAVTGALLFTALPACNAGADALVRSRIPDGVQARAWGLVSVLSQSGYLLAFAVVGPVADHLTEPLMADGGALAGSVGLVTGTGPGRGSALLVSVLGALVLGVAAVTHRRGATLSVAGSPQPPVRHSAARTAEGASSDRG